MSAIFYSQIEAHLKIQGNYVGKTNSNLTILKNFYEDEFLEFIPRSSKYFTVNTTLKDTNKVKCLSLKNDLFISPIFEKKRNLPYKTLFQKIFNVYGEKLIVTAISDGSYKFFCDGAVNYVDELPFLVNSMEIKIINQALFIIFYAVKTLIFAFDLSSGELTFKRAVDEFLLDDNLTTVENYKTIIPARIYKIWDISNGFNCLNKRAQYLKTKYEINPKLLSVAFIELISIGADTSFLLSNEIKNREAELHDFISKPTVVFPYYKDFNKTVAVYNDSIKIYTIFYDNNFINNVIEE